MLPNWADSFRGLTMNDTEMYLRSATRGLWGKERRALRTELQGHIQVRVSELMVAGFSPAEAERQTLRELGAPQQVSRGMAGVYALSTAIKGTVMTSILAFGVLLTVQQGQAQVKGIFGSVPNGGTSAYVNIEQLKQELTKAGGGISSNPDKGYMGTLKLPGAPHSPYPMRAWPGTVLQQDGQDYLDIRVLLGSLMSTGAPLHLSGWKNPKMTAGSATIGIETDDWRVINELYAATVFFTNSGMTDFGHIPWRNLDPNGLTEITIKNSRFKAGHIYALVLPIFTDWYMLDDKGKKTDTGSLNLTFNAVQVDKDGQAKFRIYDTTQPFKLVPDETKFQKMVQPYVNNYAFWSEKNPAPGLLLELTGNFGPDAYKVLPVTAVH